MKPWLASFAILIAVLCAPAAFARTGDAAPIAYRARVLGNGLRVYTVLDRSRPEVSVQVWYRVGSKNDPPGRPGFAHLFEHLMFKGSRGMPAEQLDELTESAGGESNASTSIDTTEYHDAAPAYLLQRLLWAEAQRMGSLVIDQTALDTERRVVEEEMREAGVDDPGDIVVSCEAPGAAQGRDTPRPASDLRAATLLEVQAFHARYYRPDNAVLVVVGDFEPRNLDAWIDRYFASLSSPRGGATPAAPPAPVQRRPGKVRTVMTPTQALAVVLTYRAPQPGSVDAAALAVLGDVVETELSSPARRRILAGHTAAAIGDAEFRQSGQTICFSGVAASGRTEAQLNAALHAVVSRLRSRTVAAQRIEAAKRRLIVDEFMDRETIEGVGAVIGRAAMLGADIGQVNREPPNLQRISAADVRRVARNYLQERGCVRVNFRPASKRRRDRAGAAHQAEPAPKHAPAAPFFPAASAPPRLPEPPTPSGAAPPFRVPATTEARLPNGLRVIVSRSGAVPLATAVLATHGGATADRPDASGLTRLAAHLALFGRLAVGPEDPAAAYEDLGIAADVDLRDDDTRLILSGLASSLPQALALLANNIQHPRLPSAHLRHAISAADDEESPDLDVLTDRGLDAAVFGAAPRAHRSRGGLGRRAILRREAELFAPANVVLVVTGDVDPQAVIAQAAAAFSGWAGRAPATAPRRTPPPLTRGRMLLVDAPGAPLVEVAVGAAAAAAHDPARPAADLANSTIGGGYSARLNQQIRVAHGLVYDVSSAIETRHGLALFSARAQTGTGSAREVAQRMIAEMAAFAAQGPSLRELRRSKALLLADLVSRTRTTDDFADLLAGQAISGAPLGALADYARRIDRTTASEVRAAAARLAAPQALSLVIVGDARRLAGLRRSYPEIEVVRSADLAAF